ncbi:MAG: hypothetical protein WDA59_00480 [Methanofastidiosum sp.]|jgi:hypothetical protein
MKETLRSQKIFEEYYIMGEDRSLAKLREKLLSQQYPHKVPGLKTLKRWSAAFNWQQRIEQRDMANAKKIEQKTDETIVDAKADYRKDIKIQLSIFRVLLNQAVKKIKAGEFTEIESISDVKEIVNCYEKLIKLDLLLMGEPTENEKHKIELGLNVNEYKMIKEMTEDERELLINRLSKISGNKDDRLTGENQK